MDVIQPFPLFFEHYDIHIMLYFEGHPQYEAIEAMIKETRGDRPFIRLILTRHDQTQVDYVNDRDMVKRMLSWQGNREIHYATIDYSRTWEARKPRILISFQSSEGERVLFDFCAVGRPSPRYSGLIDPGRHSEDSSLPVMYRERSTLASPRSRILFGSTRCRIPRKIWIPIFFTGMKGYYSEAFSIGGIRSGTCCLERVQGPSKLSPGEKWIYRSAGDQVSYEIVDLQGDTMVISRENETIWSRNTAGSLAIEKITVSPSRGYPGLFTVEFTPSLLLTSGQLREARFSVSIGEHADLVTGVVRPMAKINGNIRLLLTPHKPEWATLRPVSLSIEQNGSEILITSEIARTLRNN